MRPSRRRLDGAERLLSAVADEDTSSASAPISPDRALSLALAPGASDRVTRIQKHFRGACIRRALHRHLGRAAGVPDLAKAKARAEELLPHDQEGRLLPLSCPIECFQVFGPGVYAYMRWTVLMKRVFFVAFLFSASNMVNLAFGHDLQTTSWLSTVTIGNAKGLNASCARPRASHPESRSLRKP